MYDKIKIFTDIHQMAPPVPSVEVFAALLIYVLQYADVIDILWRYWPCWADE